MISKKTSKTTSGNATGGRVDECFELVFFFFSRGHRVGMIRSTQPRLGRVQALLQIRHGDFDAVPLKHLVVLARKIELPGVQEGVEGVPKGLAPQACRPMLGFFCQ